MGLSSWRIEVVDRLIRPEEIRLKGSPGPTSQAVSVFNVNVRKESQRITSSAGPDMTHRKWHRCVPLSAHFWKISYSREGRGSSTNRSDSTLTQNLTPQLGTARQESVLGYVVGMANLAWGHGKKE